MEEGEGGREGGGEKEEMFLLAITKSGEVRREGGKEERKEGRRKGGREKEKFPTSKSIFTIIS
jgi:hypothetical protein